MSDFSDMLVEDVRRSDTTKQLEYVVETARTFSAEQRQKYAKQGIAMSDGSFPIPDRDALGRAIKLAGNASDPAAAKAHIKKRAKALGATNLIPDEWAQDGSPADVEPDEDEDRELILVCPNCGLVQSAVDADRCSNCGQDLTDTDPQTLTRNTQVPGTSTYTAPA